MAKKSKKNLSAANLMTCAVYALIGILLIVLRAGSLGWLMLGIGALLVLLGVLDIAVNADVLSGVVEAAIGVVIIICRFTILDWMLLILGLVLIVKGILDAYEKRKASAKEIVVPLILIAIGVMLVIARWKFANAICIIAGIFFLINAVLVLFGKSLTK